MGRGERRGRVVLALAVALASGCSGGGSKMTEGPADALMFCEALHAAEVERLVACSAGVRAPLAATYGQAWRCETVMQSIAMGKTVYDRAQAGACLDWLAHLPCGHALRQPYSAGPCEAALIGQVADGAACVPLDLDLDLTECARTSRCDTSMTCPGICRPNVVVGQPCDASTPCERGAYCGALHAGDPRTCVAIGGPGESCDATHAPTVVLGEPVAGSADSCVEGYHCDLDRAVCVPDSPEDPCKRGETLCPNGVCTLEPVDTDPSSSATVVRFVCHPVSGMGGCAALGTGGQITPYCPPGSRCGSGSACVPELPAGAACDPSASLTSSFCAGGFGCGTSLTCEPLGPPAGFTCTYDSPCGHPGENCCFSITSTQTIAFGCGAGATCSPTLMCIAN